jgi:hypothetical protein
MTISETKNRPSKRRLIKPKFEKVFSTDKNNIRK